MASPVENLRLYMYMNNIVHAEASTIDELPRDLPSHYDIHIIKNNLYFKATFFPLIRLVTHLQIDIDTFTVVSTESMSQLRFIVLVKDFDICLFTPHQLEPADTVSLARSLST